MPLAIPCGSDGVGLGPALDIEILQTLANLEELD